MLTFNNNFMYLIQNDLFLPPSGYYKFTDVLLQAAAHLVLPLSLCSHWKSDTALPLGSCGLLLGAIPVEVADRQAVDINILTFLHYVRHTNPELTRSWGTPLCIISQVVVFHHVSWRCQSSSLSDAVLICIMKMFGFLNGKITLSVSFDALKTH